MAGQDRANPIGTILSAAMLLRLSLGRTDAADVVEGAVTAVLEAGYRTADLARTGHPDELHVVGTAAFADAVVESLTAVAAAGAPTGDPA
jgi:3-isopropylmalate dehydrogenase